MKKPEPKPTPPTEPLPTDVERFLRKLAETLNNIEQQKRGRPPDASAR